MAEIIHSNKVCGISENTNMPVMDDKYFQNYSAYEKCKCINCMNLYCSNHLKNHRDSCVKICRFCKLTCNEGSLINCITCKGWYCQKCHDKHKLRTDKYKVVHNDKCKKELTNKLLQGDTIEHPLYIKEKNLKIDYNYYLTNQIQKPVYQIFELVMKNPESIIAELVRKMNNLKNGNHSIKQWLTIGKKTDINKIENENENENKNLEKIISEDYNEEDNMLSDKFEEDIIEDLDIIINDNDIIE